MSARGIREQPVAAGTAQAVILYGRLEAMLAAAQLVLVLVRPADRIEPAPVLIGSLRKLAEGANLRLRVLDQSGADPCSPAAPCSAGSHLHSLFGGPAGPPRDLGERSPQHFAEAAKPKPESASATAPLWAVNS